MTWTRTLVENAALGIALAVIVYGFFLVAG